MKRKATPTVIQEIVTNILAKDDRMPPEQMLGRVKSELLARGLSRVGAKSLLAEAIKKLDLTMNSDQTLSPDRKSAM
jgi:hypothetical protein